MYNEQIINIFAYVFFYNRYFRLFGSDSISPDAFTCGTGYCFTVCDNNPIANTLYYTNSKSNPHSGTHRYDVFIGRTNKRNA